MAEENNEICTTCNGKKVIEGVCQCSMEWRGTQGDDGWQDCQCTPEQTCPTCHGTGVVRADG